MKIEYGDKEWTDVTDVYCKHRLWSHSHSKNNWNQEEQFFFMISRYINPHNTDEI